MRADNMTEKLLRLVKGDYQSTRARVRAYSEETETFKMRIGVRHGCALSPILFNYAIDYIPNGALRDYAEVKVGRNVRVSDRVYANDIVLVGSNCEDVQATLNRVKVTARGCGVWP